MENLMTVKAEPYILWQKEPDSNISGNSSAIVVGDKLYAIMSGHGDRRLAIYDFKLKQWSLAASTTDVLTSTNGFNGYQLAAVDNKVYAIGDPYLAHTNSNQVLIYDIETDGWSTGSNYTDSNEVLFVAQTVAWNGKIYVFGGCMYIYNSYKYTATDTVKIYDPVTDSWSKGSNMPTNRFYGQVSVQNDKAYLIGGIHSNVPHAPVYQVDIYDFKADTWTTGSNEFAVDLNSTSIQLIGDNIYTFGGSTKIDATAPFADIYIYHIPTDTWSKSDISLTSPRGLASSFIHNDRVYVLGGAYGEIKLNIMESFAIDSRLNVLLNIGESTQLSLNHNLGINDHYNWQSQDDTVAGVTSSGLVTALGEGMTYVHCTNNDNTFADYVPFKVVDGTADDLRLAVHLNHIGDTARPWVTDDVGAVNWYTINNATVSIDADGIVTGLEAGLAVVYAEYNDNVYQIYVRVND